jgi:hypothetical protein
MQLRLMNPISGCFGRILLQIAIGLGLLSSMVYEGYQLLSPSDNRLGTVRRDLAEKLCSEAAQDLPKRPGVPSLAILNLAGDEQNYVTALLREKIAASGEYRLLESTFFGKLMREFGREEMAVSRLEDAVAIARQLGVDLVVFGELPDFQSNAETANIRLELRMAERSTGQAVFARTYSQELGGSLVLGATQRARIANSSKGRRIFVWILFTILLPIVTIPLIRRLISVESNATTLALLAGYTVVDLLVALLLTGFWIPTIWTALILVLALAGSAYYNYCIASFVERLSH